MEYEKVRLMLTPTGQGSRVFINDREVQGLIAVKAEAEVGQMTTVTLAFHAEVSAEGDVVAHTAEAEFGRHLRS